MKTRQARSKGFTLIELMVVVAVIGILAAIAIPSFLGMQEKAKRRGLQESGASAKAELHNWMIAVSKKEDGIIDENGDGVITPSENYPGSLENVPVGWLAAMEKKKGVSLLSPWNPAIPLYHVGSLSQNKKGQISLSTLHAGHTILLLGLDGRGITVFNDSISID